MSTQEDALRLRFPQKKSQETIPRDFQELVSKPRGSPNLINSIWTDIVTKYTRGVTGTQVIILPQGDKISPRRPDDDRAWDTVNLRCVTCKGACPICKAACCRYESAKQAVANADTDPETKVRAKRTLQRVERLGSRVRDISTFSLCNRFGGCGRYVCPRCCGQCPGEMCREIQCKVSAVLSTCLLLSICTMSRAGC
ncbi:hypothetical protein BDV25DRAFT_155169 [Aspergillus avenaceus]|uniref:Uncharacterized protein n=1 Tax=Aspergillus avenaceus TaxID=36643 RepID=A0A5N6TUH9_ASPAV|nr:hypothetical protein BDV25DRAFT_155169 [Aspergillus avenaceus]